MLELHTFLYRLVYYCLRKTVVRRKSLISILPQYPRTNTISRRYPSLRLTYPAHVVLLLNTVFFVCWIKSHAPRPVLTISHIGFSSLVLLLFHFHSAIYSISLYIDLLFQTQWKNSVITPVPKINPPLSCSHYRPISITPILVRLMEKLIVKDYLYPMLVHPDYSYLFHKHTQR